MPKEKNKTRREFTVEGKKYAVRVPQVQDIKEANEMRAKTFNTSLSRGDLLRDQLEGELRKRKLWNDDREEEYQTLRRLTLDSEYRLQKGGVKLSQARAIALEMTANRNKMVELLSSRTDLDSNTCEGKADASRFNFLFSCCLVYDEDDGDHKVDDLYFPNKLDDYLTQQEDPVAAAGATEFYYLVSGSDSLDAKLPENKFLKKFNFIDKKLRLIDKEGRLINKDGKHIDTDGNFIKWNADGTSTTVDPVGRAVNDKGNFDVEHSPFLDDDGNAVDSADWWVDDADITEEVEEVVEETEEVVEVAKTKPKSKTKQSKKKTVEATSEKSDN
tara:strand:- start:899 stop:1888 length:990 start_codon:yes stop_codon:yes gene_type:complete